MGGQIPLDAIPNQKMSISLGDQSCEIAVRQIGARLYASLTADGVTISTNAPAVNGGRVNLYPNPYFKGVLYWVDRIGDAPPQYDGLGTRWVLIYEEGE